MGREVSILCCGLVCLDQVTVVRKYPNEDTDQKSCNQYKSRGGNASNSCTVLATLKLNPTFFGTLALDEHEVSPETRYILDDFEKAGVQVHPNCPKYPDQICPNSVIILNQENGSRTIIHTNLGLPELLLEDFTKLDISTFSWIHFEGRNNDELIKILKYLQSLPFDKRPKFSVEVEKVGRDHEQFIPYADLVLISKDIAKSHGCNNKHQTVQYFYDKVKIGGRVVVAWGEDGAAGAIRTEEAAKICDSPAFPPKSGVVDTIGAGDTFNGSMIACTSLDIPLQKSISVACKIAGEKVGIQGFSSLGSLEKYLEDN